MGLDVRFFFVVHDLAVQGRFLISPAYTETNSSINLLLASPDHSYSTKLSFVCSF